jgi:hypothetical protein
VQVQDSLDLRLLGPSVLKMATENETEREQRLRNMQMLDLGTERREHVLTACLGSEYDSASKNSSRRLVHPIFMEQRHVPRSKRMVSSYRRVAMLPKSRLGGHRI